MRTLSIKLSSKLEALLNVAAAKKRASKSEVLRQALEQYVEQEIKPPQGSVLELADDLRGSIKGGPKDLSFNKRYLKGYGR